MVNGRSSEKAQVALAGWREYGDRVCFIAADVTTRADCDRLVDQSIAQFGGLHILVNNCGAMARTGDPSDFVPVHEQPDEAMQFSWNVNLMPRSGVPDVPFRTSSGTVSDGSSIFPRSQARSGLR